MVLSKNILWNKIIFNISRKPITDISSPYISKQLGKV